jgi:hypothetical protein
MKVCKRILAGLTLLLAAAGLLLSLVAGVGVWMVRAPVTAKAARVFGRIEAALDVADKGLDHVKTSLANAAERLDGVKQEQRKLAQEPRAINPARRFLARTVQQKIAPDLDQAHEALHTVAEAAVVVNTVLEDIGNFPFLDVSGLDVGRLSAINSRLSEVAPAAWELSRLLGAPDPADAGADAAGGQLSRVEQTLQTIRGLIAEYEPLVKQTRERTEQLKSWTLPWVTPATALVSFVCFWIALSQVSLLAHAASWWKSSGRTDSWPA